MYIYWKDMETKEAAKPLIDNTPQLIEELQHRVTELEQKVEAITTKIDQHFGTDVS